MARTFQDRDFLRWEVYPSGGEHGFSDNPYVIFNCLTSPDVRPRFASLGADGAEAQKKLWEMDDAALVGLLDGARNIR